MVCVVGPESIRSHESKQSHSSLFMGRRLDLQGVKCPTFSYFLGFVLLFPTLR